MGQLPPPQTCYEIVDNTTSEKIYCYKFAKSDHANFKFTWMIDSEVDNIHSSSTPFYYPFVIPIEHIINLKVNFTF